MNTDIITVGALAAVAIAAIFAMSSCGTRMHDLAREEQSRGHEFRLACVSKGGIVIARSTTNSGVVVSDCLLAHQKLSNDPSKPE